VRAAHDVSRVSQRRKRPTLRITVLSILIVIIIMLLSAFVPQLVYHLTSQPTIGQDGIGVTSVDGEDIGISDGRYALDTDRANKDAVALKGQASESLRKGNLDLALAEWNATHEKDTSDAEPLIYAENQRVLASGRPYITIVLGVSLGVNVYDGFSRDALQGAYIVQKECNENPQLSGGQMLRLLIARSGSNPDRTVDIARQIVQAAQFDKTIVGVQGWTTSATTLKVVHILADAHLPIIAADTASDELTSISPYFFRIGTPSSVSIRLKTTYIENQLKSQRVVIFKDPDEPFSRNLSANLVKQFTEDKYKHFSIEEFQTADEVRLAQQVQKALTTYKPDLLYITTNTVGDVATLLNSIPATAEYANLKVFTGGAGYELVQSANKPGGYARLLFSSSAYPDGWLILAPGEPEPPFFKAYSAVYDSHNQPPYTYRRANGEVMMHYDALYAFLVGNKIAGKQDPIPEDIKNALSQINGSQSFQGITGAISFGPDGNPINKVHFILRVADGGFNHLAAYRGCFLLNTTCDDSIHILE
jgi:ABC-type branched-subunit amino acid transport system substrate-binding protein